MAFFSRLLINILCVAALLCSYKAVATDDEYMKMLETEAEDLEVDKSGQLEYKEQANNSSTEGLIKENWTSEGDLEGDVLPPGLAHDEFVTLLKQNFFGSFVFYRKLNSIDQKTIYYHYTKASPAYLNSIRQDILDYLKQ